ncbi:MAG: glycoside hydrolase family 20 zincin-like fold domain-containing protein [Bryobacterales bacterium]
MPRPRTQLSDEIRQHTGLRWPISSASVATDIASVRLRIDPAVPGPEGYRIRTTGRRVEIAGTDKRGVLFGVGRLLRSLDWGPGRVTPERAGQRRGQAGHRLARPSARLPPQNELL